MRTRDYSDYPPLHWLISLAFALALAFTFGRDLCRENYSAAAVDAFLTIFSATSCLYSYADRQKRLKEEKRHGQPHP